jgi:hypothetical protein
MLCIDYAIVINMQSGKDRKTDIPFVDSSHSSPQLPVLEEGGYKWCSGTVRLLMLASQDSYKGGNNRRAISAFTSLDAPLTNLIQQERKRSPMNFESPHVFADITDKSLLVMFIYYMAS